MRRPSASTIRNWLFRTGLPVRIESILARRSSTIWTGTIFSPDPDCAMRLRHASSVCALKPCAAQNSLRLRPLCSNSDTSRSASARLRLRSPALTPIAFMPSLQHRSNDNGRMALLECIRSISSRSPVMSLHFEGEEATSSSFYGGTETAFVYFPSVLNVADSSGPRRRAELFL